MDGATIYDMIENYRVLLDQVIVQPYIFLNFTIILFAVSIIRLVMLIKFQQSKSKLRKVSNTDSIYIFGHILFELLAAFIVCYFIIKLTFANPESYIINYIIAPAIGELFAVWFDNGVIIKLEGGNSITDGGFALSKFIKKKDTSSSNNGGGSNINININGNNSQVENTKPTLRVMDTLQNSPMINNIDHLDEDDIDNDHFDQIIVNAINEIKDIQAVHTEQITANADTLNNIATIVDTMRESEMNDKKIQLKRLMYECLDQGYATPEQNDMVVTYYKSYTALNGNGEIKSLYEEHYKNLDIHRDRRITESLYTGANKRKTNNNCIYGQFDNEYSETGSE